MEKYWKNDQPQAPPTVLPTDVTSGDTGSASVLSDYDRYRLTLLSTMEREGWEAELRRYEKDMPADVFPETDIVMWWQVCPYISLQDVLSLNSTLGSLPRVPHSCTHCARYPAYPSLFCTMWATLLSSKRNCRRSPFPSWVKEIWRNANHEVRME